MVIRVFARKMPNLCYYSSNEDYSFQKPYSNKTAELIDEEVQRMINSQYARAKQILSEHQEGHDRLAQVLIEREVIMADDVEKIFGKRPWVSRTEEILSEEENAPKKAVEAKTTLEDQEKHTHEK